MPENRTPFCAGIDVGSTTVKIVLLDKDGDVLFRSYERHDSKVRERYGFER